MRYPMIALFAAAALVACSEKPPRPDPEAKPAYNAVNGSAPLAERTREQGESERLDH